MKVRFAFNDWLYAGASVYGTLDGMELSSRNFHSGTVFNGELELDLSDSLDLRLALAAGFSPSFIVFEVGEKE